MIRLMSILSMLVIILQAFLAGPITHRDLQEQDKWSVAFYDEKGNLGTITIEAGRYYELKVELINNALKTLPNDITELKLPADSTVKTPLDKYLINTLDKLVYKILIGVPCGTADGTLDVQFEQVDSTRKFLVGSLKLTVKAIAPTAIPVNLLISEIPAGSYSFVEYVLPQKNVDQLDIKWTADANNHESAKVQDIVIPAYKGVDQSFRAKIQIGVYDATKAIQKFTSTSVTGCYKLDTALQFTATDVKLPVFTKETKVAIVTNSKIESPVEKNAIKVTLNLQQAPSMLSCVLVCRKADFPSDEEIRKQDAKITEPLTKKFYKAFIPKVEPHSITWSNASRVGSYKMKCIVDSTAINDADVSSVSFIFGKDINSDLNVPLATSREPLTATHCVNWTFKTEIDLDLFATTMTAYCETIFSIGGDQNGCMKCLPKYVEDVDMCPHKPQKIAAEKDKKSLSMCVRSYPSCTSTYPNIADAFGKFVDSLKKDEDIKKLIGLADTFVLGLDTVSIESDVIPPDPKAITAKATKIQDDKVHYEVTSTLDRDVECNLKMSTVSIDNLTVEDIEDDVLIIQKTFKSHPFLFNFKDKSKPDNKIYNIIMECFNIPYVPYHSNASPVFIAGAFNRTSEEPGPKPKVDCKETPKKPECREKKKHKVPEIKGKNPMKDNTDKVNEFAKLDKAAKKKKIEEINTAIAAEKTNKGILEQAILANDLMASDDCKAYENFTECSEVKKINQGQIVKRINEMIKCGKMTETLKAADGATEEDQIKLATISLAAVSDNTDSIDKDSSDSLNKMLACLAMDAPVLLSMLDKTVKEKLPESKKDFVNLLLTVTSNMIDVSKNDEMDGTLDMKPGNKSWLIIHLKTKELKAAIEANIALMLKYGDELMKLDNFIFSKKKMVQTIPKRNLEASTAYEDILLEDGTNKITVSVPTNYLLSSVNKNITNTGALLYSKYPLLSVDNTNFSESVVGIKMYDQDNVEVPITKLDFPILIKFPQKDPKFKYCVFYNPAKSDWDSTGIETDLSVTNFVTCKLSHLTDVTIGSELYTPDEQPATGIPGWGIALIVIGCAVAAGLIIFVLLFSCKGKTSNDILVNEGTSRDIQMRKI